MGHCRVARVEICGQLVRTRAPERNGPFYVVTLKTAARTVHRIGNRRAQRAPFRCTMQNNYRPPLCVVDRILSAFFFIPIASTCGSHPEFVGGGYQTECIHTIPEVFPTRPRTDILIPAGPDCLISAGVCKQTCWTEDKSNNCISSASLSLGARVR